MSYETCNTLFHTRGAAIHGLVREWVDFSTLARCTESNAELLAEMRGDGWFLDFESRYGEIDDDDIIDALDELRAEAREWLNG